MDKSKFIQILSQLSPKSQQKFAKFLESPYFGKQAELLNHYIQILKIGAEVGNPGLERQHLFPQLFPEREYNEKVLRYALSDLTKQLELFLSVENYLDAPFERNLGLLQAYAKLNLEKYFYQQQKFLKELLLDQPFRDIGYFLSAYRLEDLYYETSTLNNNHNVENNLGDLMEVLDKFFVSSKLKLMNEAKSSSNVFSVEYNPLFVDEIQAHLNEGSNLAEIPIIRAYSSVWKCIEQTESKSAYQNLLQILDRNEKLFPPTELNNLYVYAQNYCVRLINQGKTEYLEELFLLYKKLLSNKLILKNGYLSQWSYKNIIFLGLRLNKIKWTKQFIEKEKDLIHADKRENAYHYNLAYYHHFQKDYGKTLDLLHSVEFTDVFYILDSKALLMKTYYELEEVEPLYSLVDSFRVYLKRNKKVASTQKNHYSNFIRFCKKLIDAKLNPKRNLSKLKEEMESTGAIADISWIRKKVMELEESFPL